ncbi:MAG: SAM hydrolase/SAM-dependent halogenase family protein, partial [Planctomycetota bacterium]
GPILALALCLSSCLPEQTTRTATPPRQSPPEPEIVEAPQPEPPPATPRLEAEEPEVVERYMAAPEEPTAVSPVSPVVKLQPPRPRPKPEPERPNLLVLLTDFGNRDYYVGAVKGAAYRVNPRVRIESVTHQVEPFDVREGAVTLALAAREFPPQTVFVAVVDPGVGGDRRAIALRTKAGRLYVAPDNGLLTLVAREEGIGEVRDITDFRPIERPPSKTFHGRDLFVPTGALLAAGTPLSRVGPSADGIKTLALAEPALDGGVLKGMVVRVDRHGNVVTNIPKRLVDAARLRPGRPLRVKINGRLFDATFGTAYADVAEGQTVALLDSLDHLELAVHRGSLARRVGARPGKTVEIRTRQ